MRDTTSPATNQASGGSPHQKAAGEDCTAVHWMVYGFYGTTRQYAVGVFPSFMQAAQCVRRNPFDDLTVIKILSDGTPTTEF